MGLIKFKVDSKAIEMLDKRLMSYDCKDKIYYMVFKMGNESWDLVDSSNKQDGFWERMIKNVDPKDCAHLFCRGCDGLTDAWIKFCPDEAPIKTKTLFSTASDSLTASTKTPKVQLTVRDYKDLNKDNKIFAPIFNTKKC